MPAFVASVVKFIHVHVANYYHMYMQLTRILMHADRAGAPVRKIATTK